MRERSLLAAQRFSSRALGLILLAAGACGVPEQSLRDEQERSRKFRAAWESEHDENVALKAKLAEAEKKSAASCAK